MKIEVFIIFFYIIFKVSPSSSSSYTYNFKKYKSYSTKDNHAIFDPTEFEIGKKMYFRVSAKQFIDDELGYEYLDEIPQNYQFTFDDDKLTTDPYHEKDKDDDDDNGKDIKYYKIEKKQNEIGNLKNEKNQLLIQIRNSKPKTYEINNDYDTKPNDINDIYNENQNNKLDNMEDAAPYAQLSLMLQQTVHLGICGKLDYTAAAGAVFGKVPFPLLNHFMGNQSYAYDPYRFSLMNESQYAADKYLTAHIHWNMEGLIFNKIPYIRALRLRELIEVKFAYGYLNNKHQEILPFPYDMKSLHSPYVELGAGIGNIFRIIDLYAVFRITNLQDKSTPWWGIKARFSFGL